MDISLDASSDPIMFTKGDIVNGADGSFVEMTFACGIGTCATMGSTYIVSFTTEHGEVPIPEPSTVSVFGVGLGMLGLMVMWRRRRPSGLIGHG